ncbi:MAG: 50S ribosomal protein L21 [Anaerolineae bacterium]|jgi:large subunit ribosomal protein L21|nr:50S ribosomal protein L21 [Anaerolineae bacterium]
MYAIVRVAGHQYRAEAGQTIDVDRLHVEVGSEIVLKDVLLIGDGDKTVIGSPLVEGAAIKATVEEQFRDKKVIVFKWHVSTVYRSKRGHRHHLTRLRIQEITV